LNFIGSTSRKLLPKNIDSEIIIIDIKVNESEGSLFIFFDTPEKPLYTINNELNENIEVSQINEKSIKLSKLSKINYFWDNNQEKHILIIKIKDQSINIELDKVSEENQIFKYNNGLSIAYISVEASGTTLICNISPKNLKKSKDKKDIYFFRLTNNIQQFGFSLIDNTPEELAFVTFEDFYFRLKYNIDHQFVSISIGEIQIDNQTRNSPFPILFLGQNKTKGFF
jgi:hypothetical protein